MESIVENQWLVDGKWSDRCPRAQLPDTEHRPPWSNVGATLQLHPGGLEPPLGHRWCGEWRPMVGCSTDAGGWRYGVNWLVFLYPESGGGFGSSSASPSGCAVRRRLWTRAYERGAPPLPPPPPPAATKVVLTAAAAAAAAAMVGGGGGGSPPTAPPDAAAGVLSALRGGAAPPLRSARAYLPPAEASADLAAVAALLPVLRKGVAYLAGAPPSEQRARVLPTLQQCTRDLLRCLAALAEVARGGGRGAERPPEAPVPPAPWPRIAQECAALQRAVAEEARQLTRAAAPPAAAKLRAASATDAAAGGGESGGRRERGAPGGGAAASQPRPPGAAPASPPAQRAAPEAPLQQAFAQLSEAQALDDEAAEREEDINSIAQGVTQLADMFKDLAAMVEGQGEALATIESNTAEAKARAAEGVKHLEVADKHHRNAEPCAVV